MRKIRRKTWKEEQERLRGGDGGGGRGGGGEEEQKGLGQIDLWLSSYPSLRIAHQDAISSIIPITLNVKTPMNQ